MAHDPDGILRQVGKVDEDFKGLHDLPTQLGRQGQDGRRGRARVVSEPAGVGRQAVVAVLCDWVPEREDAPVSEDGSPAKLHSWQQRTYFSVFGPVRVRRRRYALPSGGGVCPLDAQLSLGPRCYSDVLSGWLEFALTNDAYDQAAGLLERILGVGIAKHALERMAVEDAGDVEAFYDQKPPPPKQEEGSILVMPRRTARACA